VEKKKNTVKAGAHKLGRKKVGILTRGNDDFSWWDQRLVSMMESSWRRTISKSITKKCSGVGSAIGQKDERRRKGGEVQASGL